MASYSCGRSYRPARMAWAGVIICGFLAAPALQAQVHSADTDGDQRIGFGELLRVVQLYNAGGHCCAGETASEDGFLIGAGATSCGVHAAEYLPADWRIDLSEMLQMVQLYNLESYHARCGLAWRFLPGTGEPLDCAGEDPVDLLEIPESSFVMGGETGKAAACTVTLSAYTIGKYEITMQQFCDALNWAHAPARQYLRDEQNGRWSGDSDVYAGESLRRVLSIIDEDDDDFEFVDGHFRPRAREGLPLGTLHSTAHHPVHNVTWYGAALFANWVSEMEGLDPVYDTATWEADFTRNGYHLPTEAQWERAAAWDGARRWTYGFTADVLAGFAAANFYDPDLTYANPLGLLTFPTTAPVGWFNGVNVHPESGEPTTDAVSPVGAYDMTGNVWEWCHDWYASELSPGDSLDPTGPPTGEERVFRGGGWNSVPSISRTDFRNRDIPGLADPVIGFRLAR